MPNHSKLVEMRVVNIGCVGPEGLTIALDKIVCLVGENNTGKSTVLRAYEAAVGNLELKDTELCARRGGGPASVEIVVHIPEGTPNIGEEWKEVRGELRLVKSRWEWAKPGKPVRTTWDPKTKGYSEDAKASGLDPVFGSRLPRPLRIQTLQGPANEHYGLLDLILDPIAERLGALADDAGSELNKAMARVAEVAGAPVSEFEKVIGETQAKLAAPFGSVFRGAELKLKIGVELPDFVPLIALREGSSVAVKDRGDTTQWNQQGIGAQRVLFWSMLQVRCELKKSLDQKNATAKAFDAAKTKLDETVAKLAEEKKEEKRVKLTESINGLKMKIAELESGNSEASFLPGHMLLIDEPEVALHPGAVRAASDHLYGLAAEDGWQVMLTTHHPAFVDPFKDHTTIVRLERTEAQPTPRTYRSDEVKFDEDIRENLKLLLRCDGDVAEMFFGALPVIVEGDTEFAAIRRATAAKLVPFGYEPLVVRARGKDMIVALMQVLTAFRVPFSVLHDADSPFTKTGDKASSAWSANQRIMDQIELARGAGLRVVHRVCIPEFEAQVGLFRATSDKPYSAWEGIGRDSACLGRVQALLGDLTSPDASSHAFAGESYMETLGARVREWAVMNCPEDPAFFGVR